MIAFTLSELELGEFWHDEAPRDRGRGAFPLVGVPGTDSTGMVYFEIAPGESLDLHTDSPDELVVILSRRPWQPSVAKPGGWKPDRSPSSHR